METAPRPASPASNGTENVFSVPGRGPDLDGVLAGDGRILSDGESGRGVGITPNADRLARSHILRRLREEMGELIA